MAVGDVLRTGGWGCMTILCDLVPQGILVMGMMGAFFCSEHPLRDLFLIFSKVS